MTKVEDHKWEFKPRFRRHTFGWKSQPVVQRVRQAVREIKTVARSAPVLGAEGAVMLLERLSPALERVDSSSGVIGTAVNRAIAELVPIIAGAPADPGTLEAWLERLWAAHAADEIPYIERLADHWGELCASKEVASAWSDRLISITRMALSPDKNLRGHFHGTSACLSALYRAERYGEIVDILQVDTIWPYQCWAVKALAAMGKQSEAIRYAESSRGPWTQEGDLTALCEEILLSSGLVEEAYERYGLAANRASTYVATFRGVAKKYPHKTALAIITDLAKSTPGDEGKWFAAAKEAGLYDDALVLASRAPCDPKTLIHAARDLQDTQPAFALGAGLLALHWLVHGYGYEITSTDVWAAYSCTMHVAERTGTVADTRERVKELVASGGPAGFVARILGRELDRRRGRRRTAFVLRSGAGISTRSRSARPGTTRGMPSRIFRSRLGATGPTSTETISPSRRKPRRWSSSSPMACCHHWADAWWLWRSAAGSSDRAFSSPSSRARPTPSTT